MARNAITKQPLHQEVSVAKSEVVDPTTREAAKAFETGRKDWIRVGDDSRNAAVKAIITNWKDDAKSKPKLIQRGDGTRIRLLECRDIWREDQFDIVSELVEQRIDALRQDDGYPFLRKGLVKVAFEYKMIKNDTPGNGFEESEIGSVLTVKCERGLGRSAGKAAAEADRLLELLDKVIHDKLWHLRTGKGDKLAVDFKESQVQNIEIRR